MHPLHLSEQVRRSAPRARSLAALACALALGGCATVDLDQELAQANASQRSFTQGHLTLAREPAQRAQAAQTVARVLSAPLTLEGAVQVALDNNPALHALWAQHLADLARANQSGRMPNPIFSFERIRSGEELEIGRLLSFGLLDLLLLPQRQVLAGLQQEHVRIQLASSVVDQVSAVRQSWVRAVAAQQTLAYARQVQEAAEASAELARRMQQAGNFNRLQRARQHAFYADATARLAGAQHAAAAAREDLVRRLGLDEAQADRLRLPERLPDLPAQPREPSQVAQAAREQRLDWQLARVQLQAAGQAQNLDLVESLVDAELGLRRDTRLDGGERTTARGWELDLRLPLFDWGSARRASMNARSLAAAHRYDAVVRAAGSQLRESYSAYRTAWEIARHYRDEIVPLRRTMSEENLLRYNGMLIGVFELLADTRDQVASVIAAIDAQQQFWLADASLSAALIGRPLEASPRVMPGAGTGAAAGAGTAKPGH